MAVTDSTKLAIYNGALRRLGSRKLASLTENREPRRVMDDIWGAASEVVNAALERGEWNFAIRTVQGGYSTSVTPPFGLSRAFDKPYDIRRLISLSSDPYFKKPLTDGEYVDEAGHWFTDVDVIYVRYVSDDPDYGLNGAKWSEAFKEYLECKMAWEACERITNSAGKKDRLDRDMRIALKTAKSHDAMAEGVKFPPRGSWVRARGGYNREIG